MSKKIIFIWDNFGPIHSDRASAVANFYAGQVEVIGIELHASSDTYDWKPESGSNYKKITISKGFDKKSLQKFLAWLRLVKELLKCLGGNYFFCHYERPQVFFSAIVLRVFFQKIFIMNDSKFDDYDRHLWKELFKAMCYFPYKGGLASGTRARDYMRFLGIPRRRIQKSYNSMDLSRIRKYANSAPAPDGLPYQGRHISVIARLVEKKNLFITLKAYEIYAKSVDTPRLLKIAGSGPLESKLKQEVVNLGIADYVEFTGFIQTDEVSKLLSNSLCLILLSTEEQFGNVVIESSAMGVPCIISTACGARDDLVRTGVNGFVVEPDNPEGVAFFLKLLCENENLWETMAKKTCSIAEKSNVSVFVNAVRNLSEC